MKPDLDIDLLRAFLAVAETSSFTAASQRLGRVQSAVSAQIKKLEQAVGAEVFSRGRGRSVSLTGPGDALASYARRMLALNEEALAAVGQRSMAGKVRLGTTDTYAQSYLPQVLTLFTQANPGIELEVLCKNSAEVLSAMDRDEIDLALVTRQHDRSDGVLIRREQLSWATARDRAPLDSSPIPLAFMPEGCAFRAAALAAFDKAGRPWRMAFHSEGPAGVRAAVSAGLAVTVLPRSTLGPMLVPLGIQDGFPTLPSIEIVVHRNPRSQLPAVTRLMEDIATNLVFFAA
ncbi:LysR substrate-binding domain-containing protein [Pelagibius sp. Alg239-R121]|uniref:LysR substrate-binding domain-containing protein n=1 Tax=Pelagibius sp. Alg239-R121 TaxID=2993448 RepID=UPI0024A767BB|nr:LysR substrate-binding domain-containing protein [Pelagibius sp. Alg239-R121]